MTSSERISTSRATPSKAPSSTPKAAPAGADDFAAKLTQARGSSNAASKNSAPAPKAGAAPEAATAAEETQRDGATSAPKSAKAARAPRDPKETEGTEDREDAASSAGQLPAEAATTSNEASAEADVAAQSAALADATSGGTVASVPGPEVSALAGTLLGQSVAPASNAQDDQNASKTLPGGGLVAADELRPKVAQRLDKGAEQTVLAVVTDALQATASVANAADGNAASASATALQNAAPDTAANATLSQLTSVASANEPSALTRNAQSVPQHSLHTPVGARGWSDELATRLTWMVDQRQQAATLRLTPENLGPLEVRIDVRENQVSVWFGASQADTRAALESALPRLREMLQGQGLSLADAGVFQQSHRESPKNTSAPQGVAFGEVEGASEMSVALRVGLFDGYA